MPFQRRMTPSNPTAQTLLADTTDREIYMAESVRWHLNHFMLFRWRLAVRGAAANSS